MTDGRGGGLPPTTTAVASSDLEPLETRSNR